MAPERRLIAAAARYLNCWETDKGRRLEQLKAAFGDIPEARRTEGFADVVGRFLQGKGVKEKRLFESLMKFSRGRHDL